MAAAEGELAGVLDSGDVRCSRLIDADSSRIPALFRVCLRLLAALTVKVQNHANFVAIQQIRRTSIALFYETVADSLPALELP